jgi:hypothetical protein
VALQPLENGQPDRMRERADPLGIQLDVAVRVRHIDLDLT